MPLKASEPPVLLCCAHEFDAEERSLLTVRPVSTGWFQVVGVASTLYAVVHQDRYGILSNCYNHSCCAYATVVAIAAVRQSAWWR